MTPRRAMPEIVDAYADAPRWSVRDSGNPTTAYMIPTERALVAPTDESDASGSVRAHEMLHVRWSMETPFPEHLPIRLLQTAEDGRVHTLARDHGIAGMFAALPLASEDERAARGYAAHNDVSGLAGILVCGYGVIRGERLRAVVDEIEREGTERERECARRALSRFERCARIFDSFAYDPLSSVRVAEILAEPEPEPEPCEDGKPEPEPGDESEPEPGDDSGNGSGNDESESESESEQRESEPEPGDESGNEQRESEQRENESESAPEPSESAPEPKPEPSEPEPSESAPEPSEPEPEPFDRERIAEACRNAPTMPEREQRERENEQRERGRSEPEPFEWSAPEWQRTNVTVPVRATAIGGFARGQSSGPTVMSPARFATDGRVFGKRVPAKSGTVLVDASASCALSLADLDAIVRAAPAAAVVGYADRGAYVLARNGKRVASMPDMGGCNRSDGPLLEWLSRMPEPRVWISDGQIHDNGSCPPEPECERLRRLITRARIVRIGPRDAQSVAKDLAANRRPRGEPETVY